VDDAASKAELQVAEIIWAIEQTTVELVLEPLDALDDTANVALE
jgi:predicted transcriptional regulator